MLSDRFGAQRVLVIGLAQAISVLAYVFVSTLGPFYAVAALAGFIYAGTMPLYAVIIRENFSLKMMGRSSAAPPWPAASACRRDRCWAG